MTALDTTRAPLPHQDPDRTRWPDAAALRRTHLLRLVEVELRKVIATRAGVGLLVGIGVLMLGMAIAANIVGPASAHTFEGTLQTVLNVVCIFTPIIGLMLFTSEWSTRTTMTTFALTPRRRRVVIAKVTAAALVGVTAFAATAAASAVSVLALGVGGDAAFRVGGDVFAQAALWSVLIMLFGTALGALVRNTPAAIVGLFVLPIVTELLSLWTAIRTPLDWTGLDQTVNLLLVGPLDGSGWAHVLAGIGIWVVLPSVIGLRRIMRQDIA